MVRLISRSLVITMLCAGLGQAAIAQKVQLLNLSQTEVYAAGELIISYTECEEASFESKECQKLRDDYNGLLNIDSPLSQRTEPDLPDTNGSTPCPVGTCIDLFGRDFSRLPSNLQVRTYDINNQVVARSGRVKSSENGLKTGKRKSSLNTMSFSKGYKSNNSAYMIIRVKGGTTLRINNPAGPLGKQRLTKPLDTRTRH